MFLWQIQVDGAVLSYRGNMKRGRIRHLKMATPSLIYLAPVLCTKENVESKLLQLLKEEAHINEGETSFKFI